MPVYTVRLRQDVRYYGGQRVEAASAAEARAQVEALPQDELRALVAGSASLYADDVVVHSVEDEQGRAVS